MAQKTAWTGAALTESDINTYLMHEGGAWTSYTPTLVQSGAVTKTVTYAKYGRAGRFIYGNVTLAVTGTGTASNQVNVGLPVASVGSVFCIGSGYIFDSSAAVFYQGALVNTTTTTGAMQPGGGLASYLGVVGFTAALASGDVVSISFHYEAAS